MTDQPTLILIRESAKESWVRDLSTFASLVGLIGIGVWLDSSAMQWIGAILGFLSILSRASDLRKRSTMTIEQARAKLDEMEAAHAQ